MNGKRYIIIGLIGVGLFFAIHAFLPIPCFQPTLQHEFLHSPGSSASILIVLLSIMCFAIENIDWVKKEAGI